MVHVLGSKKRVRILLPVDGAHATTCEEMAAVMSSAENSACQGLHQCIEIVISEVSIRTLMLKKYYNFELYKFS